MYKAWLEHYQQGVPHEINPDEHASLVAMLEESCRLHANRVAYVNMGHELTYEQLDIKSKQFAIYLQQLGLKKVHVLP